MPPRDDPERAGAPYVIAAPATSRRRRRVDPRLWSVAIVVALLAAWEVAARTEAINPLFFPEPTRSLRTFWDMVRQGLIWDDLAVSGNRLGRGFLLGAGAGAVVGVILGWSKRAYAIINPLIALVHPLPKISLFPLFLLIFGLGETPKIAVIAVSAFFPMVINTVLGVREINPELLEVARSYRASRPTVLRRVVLPGSLPAVLAGARLSLNTAVVITVAIELVTSGDGIGSRVWNAWQNLRTDQLFATLLIITIFGVASNALLHLLEDTLTPWRKHR